MKKKKKKKKSRNSDGKGTEIAAKIHFVLQKRFFSAFLSPSSHFDALDFPGDLFQVSPRFGNYWFIALQCKWWHDRCNHVKHTVCLQRRVFLRACGDTCISADILKGNSNILELRGVITSEVGKVTSQECQKLNSFCCSACVCSCVCVGALAKTMPPTVATVVYHSSH